MNYLEKNHYHINDIHIVGGVAANKKIRNALQNLSKKYNCRLILPPLSLCSDNAVMIANTCLQHYKLNMRPDIYFKPDPKLALN